MSDTGLIIYPTADGKTSIQLRTQDGSVWLTGHSAAQLLVKRADPRQPNMGLQPWSATRVRKHDVIVAKNYLKAGEVDEINRIVVMFLDSAEDQVFKRNIGGFWRNTGWRMTSVMCGIEHPVPPLQGWELFCLAELPGRCPSLPNRRPVGAQTFQTVPKCACRTTPEEIAEDNFNLNIPRYVDTFEAEKEVDLNAVGLEDEDLEKELADVRKQMVGYLKELGL